VTRHCPPHRRSAGDAGLHRAPAMLAAPHMNAKFNALHPRFRNLGLELKAFRIAPARPASRTADRQRYVYNFIDFFGEGPTRSAPILLSCFASGPLRFSFGFLSRKGCRLSLPGPRNASSNNRRGRSISFFNAWTSCSSCAIFSVLFAFVTPNKLSVSRIETTTFLKKVPRR